MANTAESGARRKTADVAATIDDARITRFHVRIFALCLLAMTIDGFDMQILPFTASVMLKSLGAAPAMLGPLVSSAILGMVIAGFVCGLLADRFGRRSVILGGLLAFGLFTIGKGLASSYPQLLVLQFLTGIGLGGVFTNTLALAAEYSPLRNRRFIVTLVSAAFPLGSIILSYVVAALMGRIGWNGVFVVGGVLAIIICGLVAIGLPGSVRQLVLQDRSPDRVTSIMLHLAPSLPAGTIWTSSEPRVVASPVRDVFGASRAAVTIILSATMVLSLMSGYFVTSWSPLLFTMAGLSPGRAAIAASMLHAGAVVGSLIWGTLTDRFWPPAILAGAASISVICYSLIGHVTGHYGLLVIVLLAAGLGMGVQNAFNGFASSLYPTAMRATALGVIIGIGRIGSIAGPLLGGALVAMRWPLTSLYYVASGVASGLILCMILMTIVAGPRAIVRASRRPAAREVPIADLAAMR